MMLNADQQFPQMPNKYLRCKVRLNPDDLENTRKILLLSQDYIIQPGLKVNGFEVYWESLGHDPVFAFFYF